MRQLTSPSGRSPSRCSSMASRELGSPRYSSGCAVSSKMCGFTHGVEFVFLASMNTMASIVEGCTLHFFGNIAFKMEDGTRVTHCRKKDEDISKLFLRYERLRWIFIDECSTASLEVLSTLERHLTMTTRQEHTWALRAEDEKRMWGGVNMCL